MTAPDDDRPAASGTDSARTVPFTHPADAGTSETVALSGPPAAGSSETVVVSGAADADSSETVALSGPPAAGSSETVVFSGAADAGTSETVALSGAADAGSSATVALSRSADAAPAETGTGTGTGTEEPARSADAEYSATVLASHWVQRPDEDRTLVERPGGLDFPSAAPDRVEGTVLRFGPGVTAAGRTHRTLPALPQRPAPAGRRHALPALVVLCVLAFLAWQRLGPPLTVGSVTVTARPSTLGCDGTADVTGLVTTNGRPGTLTYRWVRSDGTSSGVLEEELVRGRKQARLHLRWTFQGKGEREARAELRIISPVSRTAAAGFTYSCP
ncbi:hypothetical protein ACFC5X_05100 [Streptomyces sp. NPDC055952]|uniref:hypothetical protein n=1 Tax=Streptomyces sp. NPDC055952 TaxID=3345663 RepID=UPI0035DCAEB3